MSFELTPGCVSDAPGGRPRTGRRAVPWVMRRGGLTMFGYLKKIERSVRMASIEQLQQPFAESILAIVSALRNLSLASAQRSRLLEAVSDDIRKYTDLLTPVVSVAAKSAADRLRIDLSTRGWHDQSKFDPGREVFFFEHMTPVSKVRDECLKATSVEQILSILREKLRIVWILRVENEKLNALGYSSDRADPAAAYHHAGIRIVGDPS